MIIESTSVMGLVARILGGILVMTLVAAGFSAAATRVVRRFGIWALFPLWLAASVLATGAIALRLRQVQSSAGVPESSATQLLVFWSFLPLWLLGLGAVSVLLVRRHRRGTLAFNHNLAVRSMGAFLAGFFVWGLGYAAWDISRLF